MKVVFCLILLCISIELQAQSKNYLKYRDELLNPACGKIHDSTEVFTIIQHLENFDTSSINKNLQVYYEDLGYYYWLASSLGGEIYFYKAIPVLSSALYHQPNSQKALWNLAFVYGFLHECEKAKAYFATYYRYYPKAYESQNVIQQERELLAECESN
jgi:hypothetical protein